MPVRVSRADIILYVFCMSGDRVIGMRIQDLMQLKDEILCDRDRIKTFMNDRQHIPVPGDLLFASVLRICFD